MWADEVTYEFTSNSWGAKIGSTTANWTSGKDGNQLNATQGVQVTSKKTGANATSPISFSNISKIVVVYSTNASSGAGTINIKVGSNTEKSFTVSTTGGTTGRDAEFNFSPNETGSVKLTVNCTTNSIYIKSVTITYNPTIPITSISGMASSTSIEVGGTTTLTPTILPANTTETVVWESSDEDVATVSAGVVTGVAPGSATITAKSPSDATIKAECTVNVNAASTVATPSFSVAAGTYNVTQSVTLSCATDDATIYYTTDGTTPSSSSAEYTSAIAVNQSMTIKAMAVKDGLTDSEVASATYTLKCVAPMFDPAAGNVGYGTEVTLTTTTGGATIYYTSNDDTPTSDSDEYDPDNKPTVSGNQTFKAIATKSGWSDSDVSSAAYTYYYVITAVSNNDSYGTVSGTTTITATPEDGYRVMAGDDGYTVTAGTATVVNNGDNTFTVTPTSNCTVQINFEEIPSHTVTFSVNGNTTRTATVREGASITFPTAVETTPGEDEFEKVINGQTFVGWYTAEYNNPSVAPSYVNTASMGTSDVTYYAVYADVDSSIGDETKSYGFETASDDDWTVDGPVRSNLNHYTGSYAGRITTNNSYVTFKNKVKVKEFSFAFTRSSTNANYNVFIETSSDNSSWTSIETYPMNTFNSDGTFITKSHSFDGNTELYVRFRCYNTTAERFVDDVTITYEAEVTTVSNYCTTVSLLPRPEITMADVEMTWGDDDKFVSPSALVGEDEYDGDFTFESSDDEHLTVAADGKLSCDLPGNYTVTAKIAATGSHQAAEKTCKVTVGKQNISLSFADAEVIKMVTDETYTQTATVSPVAYDGTVTYSGEGNATINSSTAKVDFTTTGVNTITATAPATDLYNGNTASYTLKVKTTPTITVNDQTMNVGDTYEPIITGGDVTISCNPEGVISVDGNVITATTVVTGATITVSTADNDTYVAGEATFTLTVNAPTGSTTAPSGMKTTTFTNKDLGNNDGYTWTASIAGNAFESSNNVRGAQFGANKGEFTITSSSFSGTITKVSMVVSTNGSNNTVSVKVGDTDFECNDATTLTLTSGDNKVTRDFVGEASGNIEISCNDKASSIWFKSITVTVKTDATVTIASSGFGTYCYEYPLDLPADDPDCKAYIATSVSDGQVTLKRIRGAIKGGVPFILYGEPGSHVIPTAASSDNVPEGNLLRGTLAPTYVTQTEGDYTNLGLSQGAFKKLSTGVVPAHKAYLHIPTSEAHPSGSLSRMTIFFVDDDDVPTGVKSIDNGQLIIDNTVYNLKGQRVEKPVKGQLYIVNGKKVVIK